MNSPPTLRSAVHPTSRRTCSRLALSRFTLDGTERFGWKSQVADKSDIDAELARVRGRLADLDVERAQLQREVADLTGLSAMSWNSAPQKAGHHSCPSVQERCAAMARICISLSEGSRNLPGLIRGA